MISIALMGHGTVGSGVVEVLTKNHESIVHKAGEEINIKYILDLRDFPDSPYADRFIKDFSIIENDDDVKIVVECLGGLHPSYEFVKRCLLAGKSVATSNKELVAEKGDELLKIAKENNLNFLFEASVGGGIPILRPLDQCLAANEVYEIAGILNGTTNFILTKMIREQMPFDKALSLAQSLGYAERDPSADINGDDACRKICILASLAFGKHVYPNQCYTEGISKITLEDVEYASNWGGVIKLIGRCKKLDDGRVTLMVSPGIVHIGGQLAGVEDVFNAILVRGDAIGDVVFYGRGAGKMPTASAVVADVIDCVKHIKARKYLFWESGSQDYVADYRENKVKFYIRAMSPDANAAYDKAKEIFGNDIQRLHREAEPAGEVAFVTNEDTELVLNQRIRIFENSGASVIGNIRIFDY